MRSPLLDCLEALPPGYFNGRAQKRKRPDPLLVCLGGAGWLRNAEFPTVGLVSSDKDYLRKLIGRILKEFAAREAVLLIRPAEMLKWHTYERALLLAEVIEQDIDLRLCFFEEQTGCVQRSRSGLHSAVQAALRRSVAGDGSVGELAHRFIASVPTHWLSEVDPKVLAGFEMSCPGSYSCNLGAVLETKGVPVNTFGQAVEAIAAGMMLD